MKKKLTVLLIIVWIELACAVKVFYKEAGQADNGWGQDLDQ